MEEIKGTVNRIIYQNPENHYTIVSLESAGEEITCVGTMPGISASDTLRVEGEWREHPTYGRQIVVSRMEVLMPDDVLSIERYLGSGAISGIGPRLAARIVARFGEDTLRVLEEEPERLSEVRGISSRMACAFSEQFEERRELRSAMLFMETYGINAAMAARIWEAYGSEIYGILRSNPYRLAEDVSGIGFKRADEIAAKAGIQADSEFRIRCGITYTLSEAVGQGHTYLPRELLISETARLLGIDPEDIAQQIDNLAFERRIVVLEDRIYDPYFWRIERETAQLLVQLACPCEIDRDLLSDVFDQVKKQDGMELDETQRRAVEKAAASGVMILTGGPGTGKTTTLKALLAYFSGAECSIEMAAPTGRAARRMSEATGYEARTVHRLLEVGGIPEGSQERSVRFGRNSDLPLETDVVIIDEASMLDITLMHALVAALAEGTRLILVGDASQLPSVGPGNVLRDMIASEIFETVELSRIFRQSEKSTIVSNARRINQGEEVPLDNAKSEDFFLMRRSDAASVLAALLPLQEQRLPRYLSVDREEIQVLCPARKGPLGVETLNPLLQEKLNPPSSDKVEYVSGERVFRVGDKVMQIRNNYQLAWELRGRYGLVKEEGLGVFNGDVGVIREISRVERTLLVQFDDGRFVEYALTQLDELELAYAITVHKSQGSEYAAVIIPLLAGPKPLMNRNLIYTAVTRARRCVVIVGSEEVFRQMCQNTYQSRRYSGLVEQLAEALDLLGAR